MKITVTKRPSTAAIAKNIRFGTALGLTRAAQAGQKLVISNLENTFTLRGNWYKPSNKMGIRINTATKTKLVSAVKTQADWLLPHEEGRPKFPMGRFFAVPTSNVRRTKRDIIRKNQRPRELKRSFLLITRKRGIPMIFQRRGRGKRSEIFAMYKLIPKAKIRKASTFYEALLELADKRLAGFIKQGIVEAFRTMK